MAKLTSEKLLESVVEEHLIARNGFFKAKPEDFDRAAGLLPATVIRFLQVTQPEKWKAYKELLGGDAEAKVLARIENLLERQGTLHLLRRGFDESGHHFEMGFFKPTSGLNPDLQKLYEGNVFQIMRQVKYSLKSEQSVDVVLLLNGLPIFTAELKNKLSGQTIKNAIRQYQYDRDPKEPLFRFARCFAHFAVDTDLVSMASALAGKSTAFLPFNQGYDGGAGNPPSRTGIATAYLWESVWTRESILDLIQRFIQVVEVFDDKGRKTGKKRQIFPRYHQLDTVRRLTDHARVNGPGHQYLNQHSAGSGKTIEIATLATSLSTLHGKDDKPVFDSVVVVSDARVIDRMLQRTLTQFVQTQGMLENIDKTSRALSAALLDGKKIIVSTIWKFAQLLDDLKRLPQSRFAIIIDEAHSSQAGETASSLNRVLAYGRSDEDKEEAEEDWEDRVAALMKQRGRMPHVSFFAFTATPKPETFQLFGSPIRGTKRRGPFTLYTMRQAIEERFIVDVLSNYTTYNQYFNLLKHVQDDPLVDKRKAIRVLKHLVQDNVHPIRRKARIMVDHFMSHVRGELAGQAKAMIVSRNRLHAVRYAVEVRAYLEELGNPFKALVAFTDTVKEPVTGKEYTEAGMNGFSEAITEEEFKKAEYRILIVANKFQTGFDQPLLTAMYVDRRLHGVTAVQTLSRLNRNYPGKDGVFVLDFENTRDDIESAFQEFYDRVELIADTDPNRLYDIRTELADAGVFAGADVDAFCAVAFSKETDVQKLPKLHSRTDPLVERFKALTRDDRRDFRKNINDYVRLYALLCQILPFSDPSLEKLYSFSSFLAKKLPPEKTKLPWEILADVSLENYKPELTGTHDIDLDRGPAEVAPPNYGGGASPEQEVVEPLSKIINDLNQQFGTNFTPDDRVVIKHLEEQLQGDKVLERQLKAGSKDAVRLSFEEVAQDLLHGLIESNFKFYKKVQDDDAVARELFDRLFDRYYDQKTR